MFRLGFLLAITSLNVWRCRTQTVTVSSSASHAIPSTLWGLMFEDISHSGDGGLYGELLQNRAFQQVAPGTPDALNSWSSINGGAISVVTDNVPVSNALPNSLRFNVPNGLSGPVGFANSGFFGIKVDSSWTYKASFHFRFPTRSSFRGNLVLGLRSSSGETLASATVPISASSTSWRQVNVSLRPSSSASSLSNQFFVTVDGNSARGQTINFAMFSLFPPTFKNRPNGMRIDIATALADMKPGVFRFPGGNNLEGQTPASRWQWNATLGGLLDRPGRVGDWSYINTDGLGLLEFLTFCEDAGMEPIMAVWSGFALGGTSIAQDQLQPFIQQAIDQIDFVISDPRTNAAAARRAALGHPSPFKLNFVEIGNEDFFAADTYTYRWSTFVGALRRTFPHLKFIATSNINDPILTPKPQVYDHHVYQTPTFFAQNSFFYDDMARDGTLYFEGEYAAISTNPNDIFGTPADGRLPFPTMQGSAGEAAYMIGMERNSDIVFAAAYAPLLGHVSNSQWTPNLVGFDSGQVFKSTSYYVQQLFSLNKGTEYLPSTLPSRNGTVFWGVTRDRTNLIIKISNTGPNSATLTFVLPFNVASTGVAHLLTGEATTSNTPTSPKAIQPSSHFIRTGRRFSYAAPAVSVTVITIVRGPE